MEGSQWTLSAISLHLAGAAGEQAAFKRCGQAAKGGHRQLVQGGKGEWEEASDHVPEKLSTQAFDRRHHQRPIEEVVVLLARRLGGQQAAVAAATGERPMIMGLGNVKSAV